MSESAEREASAQGPAQSVEGPRPRGVERLAALVPAETHRSGVDEAAGVDEDDTGGEDRVWLFSSQLDGDGEWIDVEVCDGPGGWSVGVGHVRTGEDGVSGLVGTPQRIVVQRGSTVGPAPAHEASDATDDPYSPPDPDDVATLRSDLAEATAQVIDLCNALARIARRHGMPPEVTPEDIADCAIEAADAYVERAHEVVRACGGEPGVDGWREALAALVAKRDHLEGVCTEQAAKLRRHLDELAELRAERDELLARVDAEEAAGFVRGMETAQEWVEKAAQALRDARDVSAAELLDGVANDLGAECDARLAEVPALRHHPAACASWCPGCGAGVPIDDEGCCTGCGATATGLGSDEALRVLAERAGVASQSSGPLPRCSDCGHHWTIVGGVTQDGLGWVEGTAAHECDGIGSLATFARDADGQLVTRDTFHVEEVGRLRDIIERLERVYGASAGAPSPVSLPTPSSSPPRPVPPYDELDAGIRETVRWLFDHGFEPTDSGDGASKFTDPGNRFYGLAGALDEPHVFMRVASPADLAAEADRLHGLLEERGVVLTGEGPQSQEEAEAYGVRLSSLRAGVIPGSLEASYVPGEPAVLALLGVDDRVLFGVGEGGVEPPGTPEQGIDSAVDSPLPRGTCDDGNPCTDGDPCTDGNPCTDADADDLRRQP